MSKTALLIIDVQECNFADAEPVYRGSELLANINTLVTRARAAGVLVIYVQHCGEKGAIDEPGTAGWEIHAAVHPVKGDIIIRKHHPDAFQDTDLRDELESRSVRKLVIAGIQTEYCVDTTCRRAYSLGYNVTLVTDAHSTWDSDQLSAAQIIAHHNEVLGGWFAELKETDEIQFNDINEERYQKK